MPEIFISYLPLSRTAGEIGFILKQIYEFPRFVGVWGHTRLRRQVVRPGMGGYIGLLIRIGVVKGMFTNYCGASQTHGYSSQVLRSESGKAISWAILFCAAVAGAYYYGGREYMALHLTPFYQTMVLMSGILVCIAVLGCGFHLMILGGSSNSDLRRSIRAQHDTLVQLTRESNAQIRAMESDLGRCVLKLTTRGLDCLAVTRRVARALDQRVSEVGELLASGNGVDLIDADELLRKKLIISENAMETLIGADPVPPLAPEEWVPAIQRLFAEIEAERKKVA